MAITAGNQELTIKEASLSNTTGGNETTLATADFTFKAGASHYVILSRGLDAPLTSFIVASG